MSATVQTIERGLAEEDAARAHLYALLSALWVGAPAAPLLEGIAGADDVAARGGNDPPLAREWRRLQAAAAAAEPEALRDEYRDLFVDVGEPQVVLNASWYRTGFLNEYPLAEVRDDLARAGLSRLQSSPETEDHIAALLETMRLLIVDGVADPAQSYQTQKAFFARHIQPWYAKLAQRVDGSERANFYRIVVALMRAFLDTEAAQFENY
jgi:TorA maturation chaperone TorD